MILYCDDHDTRFDTDHDTETHRHCHDSAGRRLGSEGPLPVEVDEDGYDWYVPRDRKPKHTIPAPKLNPLMQGVFDLFLEDCADDCVNGESGEWSKRQMRYDEEAEEDRYLSDRGWQDEGPQEETPQEDN